RTAAQGHERRAQRVRDWAGGPLQRGGADDLRRGRRGREGRPRVNLVTTITGLPYVGKTTLFNLLTGGHASTGGFKGAEAETNVGVAKVPDARVDRLAALYKPKKTTHAEVMYRELGLAPRAHVKGEADPGIS